MVWIMNRKSPKLRKQRKTSSKKADSQLAESQSKKRKSCVDKCPFDKKPILDASEGGDPGKFPNSQGLLPMKHAAIQCPPESAVLRHRQSDQNERQVMMLLRAVMSDRDGDRLIHKAVAQENVELTHKLCTLMLKGGVSLDLPNYLRQTPLHLAAMVGNEQLIRMLLSFGACVTLRDRNGSSVIHLSIKSGSSKEVLPIIFSHTDAKLIIDTLDYEGYSALHYAVLLSNRETVFSLYEAGAQMNITDGKSGRSPLIHAILKKDFEMVRSLLQCGACAETVDYAGRSAFDMALHASCKDIISLIQKGLTASKKSTLVRSNSGKEVHVAPRTRVGDQRKRKSCSSTADV